MDTGSLPLTLPPRVRTEHYDKVIEWMLGHPGSTLKVASLALKVDVSFLIHLVSSDSFKARVKAFLKERGQEEERLFALRSTGAKLESVADQALGILDERLSLSSGDMPTELVKSIADMSLRNLGYGPKLQVSLTKNTLNQTLLVDREALREARGLLGQVQGKLLASGGEEGVGAKVVSSDGGGAGTE